MKLLSLLMPLILGAAVLLVFIRPWSATNTILERGDKAAPAASSASDAPASPPESTVPPAPPAAVSPPDARPSSEDQKKLLLARERAEAERRAALDEQQHAAAAAPPKTKRYFQVKVRDAGTLEVRLAHSKTAVIRLEGIESHDADETCERKDGTKWPCGAKARRALTYLIRGRAVVCTLPPAGESDAFTARCGVGGEDLSTWLVRQGWAMPGADAPALGAALSAAKKDQLGLWASE